MAEKHAMSSLFSDEDILEKYHESRKANMKLLEQRRELLLELQELKCDGQRSARLSAKCEALQRQVDELQQKICSMGEIKESLSLSPPQRKVELTADATKLEENTTCNCNSAEKLKETIKVNHQWNQAYKRSVARIHEAETKIRRLEEELSVEVGENARLVDLVSKLENDLKSQSKNGYRRVTSLEEVCTKDDIEALKLQMITFKDDFNTEKDEKQKAIDESKKLQNQLDEANKVIQSLSDKVILYQHQIMQQSEQQERMSKHIQALIASDTFRSERQYSQRRSFPYSFECLEPGMSSQTMRHSDTDLFSCGNVMRD